MRIRLSLRARRMGIRCVGALLLGAPAVLAAQTPDTLETSIADSIAGGASSRLYEVSAITGYQWFDRSAALGNAPTFGLRAVNPNILESVPGLSFGVAFAFARPTTRGDYFPWTRQTFVSDAAHRNDTTVVYEVSQRVTMAHYVAEVGYRFGGRARDVGAGRRGFDWRTATAEVNAGFGGYAFWEDPEQSYQNLNYHEDALHAQPALSFGGGLGIPMPRNTTLRIRLDDLVFLRYDREWFNLHDPLFSEELFSDRQPTPPAARSTVHNLRLSVQFSFLPGAGR